MTGASIASMNPDGTVIAITVTLDGDLADVGQTLINHYQLDAKRHQLFELGDLLRVGEHIGDQSSSDPQARLKNWCTAYGRDGGQPQWPARHYADVISWLDEVEREYNYLWDGSEWLMCKPHLVGLDNYEFRSVVQCLMENES
jgi:hypothetical protein